MNKQGIKTIGFTVPEDFPYKGTEVKNEIVALFQWVVDHPGIDLSQYPKIIKIQHILGGWD